MNTELQIVMEILHIHWCLNETEQSV